jgi:hypothetical protein
MKGVESVLVCAGHLRRVVGGIAPLALWKKNATHRVLRGFAVDWNSMFTSASGRCSG